MAGTMPKWKSDCVAILKTHLTGTSDPKELRQISSAMQSIIGYDDEGPMGTTATKPLPVRIVKGKKAAPKAKGKVTWRKKGAK